MLCGLSEVNLKENQVHYRSGCGRECRGSSNCPRNRFQALAESDEEEMPSMTDSEADPGADMSGSESEMERYLRELLKDTLNIKKTRRKTRRSPSSTEGPAAVHGGPGSGSGPDSKVAEAEPPADRGTVGVLVEVNPESVNGLDDKVEEWEEIEFLVDNGASATVIGEKNLLAVGASAPSPYKHCKMAGGSLIPHKGSKEFEAVSSEGCDRWISAEVTDVEEPLLKVAQIVAAGCKVIFDANGSYIEQPNSGEHIELEQTGGLYTPKMWVPKKQPFTRQG